MGHTLVLVRHGQSEPPGRSEDIMRKLTPEGERDVRHMGRWLAGKLKKVDLLLSSTAIRAKQTAEIIVEEFRQSNIIDYKEEIYEASIRTLLREVNGLSKSLNTVMIVGHNPAISYLADFLTGSPLESMSPGSATIIDLGDLSWEEADQHTAQGVEQISADEI